MKDHATKYPESFWGEIDRLAAISRRLRREREASFYGDEETGTPPQRLYTEDDARSAIQEAGLVLARCRDLLESLRTPLAGSES